ncbi:hypothetical protein N7528_007515 [Penicillium herquei]|nr:hypothetical protein N7528_007515 [Penicillium herquei]
MSMGIQNETLSNLITVDNQYLDRTTIRRNIVEKYQDTVHGCLPGGEDAVRELYSYLLSYHLPNRFPSLFRVNGGQFLNTITKRTFPVEPPNDPNSCLRILAETVEEDIFLLKETETTHVCLAFACCFPTGFDPSEKLGKDLSGIHGPVPTYNKIGPSMERFFRRLEVGKAVRRTNWNVQTGTELINVAGNHIKEGDEFIADEEVDCSQANLRIELQSLTRLPSTKFILFCFKTFLYPLSEIKEEGSGPDLADAVDGLLKGNSPGMHRYKSAVRWGKSVTEYLRQE